MSYQIQEFKVNDSSAYLTGVDFTLDENKDTNQPVSCKSFNTKLIELNQYSNVLLSKSTDGIPYSIEPNSTENNIYTLEGIAVESDKFITKRYVLNVGTTVKVTTRNTYTEKHYIHLAYKDNAGNFIPLVKSRTLYGSEFYLTITQDMSEIFVSGATLQGVGNETEYGELAFNYHRKKYYITLDGTSKADNNFDYYVFDIPSLADKLFVRMAVGGGSAVITDEEGNVLWYYKGDGNSDYSLKWHEIDKPENGVILKVTNHKGKYPKVYVKNISFNASLYDLLFDKFVLDAKYISNAHFTIQKDSRNLIVNFTNSSLNFITKRGAYSIKLESSYTIPTYQELYVDLVNRTLKVGSYTGSDGATTLLFNESGTASYGLLVDLYNAKTINGTTSTKNNIDVRINLNLSKPIFGTLYSVTADSKENNLYTYDGTAFESTSYTTYIYKFDAGINLKITISSFYSEVKYIHIAYRDFDGNFYPIIIGGKDVGTEYYITTTNDMSELLLSGVIVVGINPDDFVSTLKNKKVLFIGDSITDVGHHVNAFVNKTGCIAYNRGLSGTTVAVNSSVSNSICERLDLEPNDLQTTAAKSLGFPSEADYVFVLGGINDWGRLRSQVFGDLNAAIDNTTFCGALKYLYRGLKLRYPNTKIVILNLLHTYSPIEFVKWRELSYEDDDESKSITTALNDVGKSLYDYREAIANAAKMYGLPVIDLFNVGFTATLDADREAYYVDGLHPNEAGGEKIAEYIIKQLQII